MLVSRPPLRAWLLLAVLTALAVSCIRPASWSDMVLEHIPTLITLGLLTRYGIRRPLSTASYLQLFVFMLLHILGAHYTYSQVPYDRWASYLFGSDLSGSLGLARNHYDRLVHFMWGLLLVGPFADMVVRFANARPGFWAAACGVGFAALGGNIYEVLEWFLTLIASPEVVEGYNGQQGDFFDAQKDLALNLLGACMSGVVVMLTGRHRVSQTPTGVTRR